MRILYVTNESPFFPFGGIGTYLSYAAKGMADAGHDVYFLTWTYNDFVRDELDYAPFIDANVRILKISGAAVWQSAPNGPYNHGLATFLLPQIWDCVDLWQIDVVEVADYLSPGLAFFQDLQSRATGRNVLCVTYNHGFTEDFYDADQIAPKLDAQQDMVGERQQCRVSDLIIAPSATAVRRLASYGIVDNVHLLREPYEFAAGLEVEQVLPNLTYIGRVSISKGIDKVVFLANVIDPIAPLEQILLIGQKINTPFRVEDIEQYVRSRLHKRLSDLVVFTGSLRRSVARNLLIPGAVSPSLGSAETFSYACIETIDRGLIPIVRHSTPMAEFFPPELQDYVFDERFSDFRAVQVTFEKLVANAARVVSGLQDHNREKLDPKLIAQKTGELYEASLRAKKGYRTLAVRKPAMIEDVTVLIPAYMPNEYFLETIDSIVKQTAGIPNVLICDDGTPAAASQWFEYGRVMLPTCRIVGQPNNGLLGARNTLIRECQTRLALFLDTDDILNPHYLERTLEAYNASVFLPDAVFTHRRNFSEREEVVIRSLVGDHTHILRNDLRMTALVDTEVLREIGFDSTRRNGEGDDWVFWLEFTAAGFRGVTVPETLFHYRFRQGSMSWPWSPGQASGTNTMVREAITKLMRRRPREAASVARALHAITTVSN